MNKTFKILILCTLIFGGFTMGASALRHSKFASFFKQSPEKNYLDKKSLSLIINQPVLYKNYLDNAQIIDKDDAQYLVHYSVDTPLERSVSAAFERGQVEHGAFVGLDPLTGEVLALVSHNKSGNNAYNNMALRATFPSASIFKIVTAAAALDQERLRPGSLIPLRGSYHTLYKQNILNSGGLQPASAERGKAWRLMSFSDAFSHSVNSIFGKIGIFGVGPDLLRSYASRLFFDQEIPFELPLEPSRAVIPDDSFGLAESASGFTRENTISPLHGAILAAAISHQGVAMEPTIVSQVSLKDGSVKYISQPKEMGRPISVDAATDLRAMMVRTVTSGTSSRVFRGANKHIILSKLEIGGKTGTLDGINPPGRYDWFVGYAMRGSKKFAFAALCVHGEYRGIKAAQIARIAIESYFRPDLALLTK